MTETVVYVTTLEQWKSVLDVWFKQGYTWSYINKGYMEEFFNKGSRQLGFNVNGWHEISYWSLNDYKGDNLIEYSDFMAQQKDDNKMETYYVTQEQLDLIEELKSDDIPFYNLVNSTTDEMKDLAQDIPNKLDSKVLRYIGGDETVEFKVKEPLYCLWRIDDADNKVYMRINLFGTPGGSMDKNDAFTAPLQEIKKWQTPAWEIEKVEVQ